MAQNCHKIFKKKNLIYRWPRAAIDQHALSRYKHFQYKTTPSIHVL